MKGGVVILVQWLNSIHYLVRKMSASEIGSVEIALISLALAGECRKILETRKESILYVQIWVLFRGCLFYDNFQIFYSKDTHNFEISLKMFPYFHLSTEKTSSNIISIIEYVAKLRVT